ncbi:MAG: hypothetical protein ABI646_09095 [Acidobacteriota bacterium]
MKFKLRTSLLLTAAIFALTVEVRPQKRDEIKPPAETATLAESEKWFVDSFVKYATYKTKVTTVTVSNAKFEGCTFSYNQARKFASTSTATMGATRTTNTVKEDISFDLGRISADGINVTDHIYPEVRTLELKFVDDGRIVEIVVKSEASEAFKTALAQIRRLCAAKN